MRLTKKYTIGNIQDFKQKLLSWAQQFNPVAFYDSNLYSEIDNNHHLHHTYELIAGIGLHQNYKSEKQGFEGLKKLVDNTNDWIFGYFGYDLKNEVEHLDSGNIDKLHFNDIEFFIPRVVFILTQCDVDILYYSQDTQPDEIIDQITNANIVESDELPKIKLTPRITKNEYIDLINKMLWHIHRGDIYEVNFCQEFYNNNALIDPAEVYRKLVKISPTPFSCFYKTTDKYLMCASPERFLKKEGSTIYSQPIKGTIRRGKSEKEDQELIQRLKSDTKELAENTMIVDLVRNDLSKTAKRGTVKVDELAGIYSFMLLHQMISTLSSELDPDFHIVDVIKNMFPMGSMTGAPKLKVMELIEKYEKTKRGLFSGAVGYFSPDRDFDFNVVIRSILYNGSNNYLSCSFGSAITSKAIAENEYEECLLKARAIFNLFNHS